MLDDFDITLHNPLSLRVDGDYFIAHNLCGWDKYTFRYLRADLVSIEECELGEYPYWRIVLKDGINTYHLHFCKTSALFRNTMLKLHSIFSYANISITPHKAVRPPYRRKWYTDLTISQSGCEIVLDERKKGKFDVSQIVSEVNARAREEATPRYIGSYLF